MFLYQACLKYKILDRNLFLIKSNIIQQCDSRNEQKVIQSDVFYEKILLNKYDGITKLAKIKTQDLRKS